MDTDSESQRLKTLMLRDTILPVSRALLPKSVVKSFDTKYGRCDFFVVVPARYFYSADDPKVLIYPEGSTEYHQFCGATYADFADDRATLDAALKR